MDKEHRRLSIEAIRQEMAKDEVVHTRVLRYKLYPTVHVEERMEELVSGLYKPKHYAIFIKFKLPSKHNTNLSLQPGEIRQMYKEELRKKVTNFVRKVGIHASAERGISVNGNTRARQEFWEVALFYERPLSTTRREQKIQAVKVAIMHWKCEVAEKLGFYYGPNAQRQKDGTAGIYTSH